MASSNLVTLKTDLKSLKFGHDRPDGGSSNQPFEITNIPDNNSVYGRDGLPARSGPDFILRDGFLAPVKGIKDISRLTKMMFDTKSPSGLLFIIKQNVLSRTGVKVEGTDGLGYAGGAINEGIYTPLGTLLQAGFGWAGIHLNKQGLDPTSPMGPSIEGGGLFPGAGLSSYYQTIRNANDPNNFSWKEEEYEKKVPNPLWSPNQLIGLIDPSTGESTTEPEFIVKKFLRNIANDLSVDGNRLLTFTKEFIQEKNEDSVLFEYGGGPGAILGFGKTKIKIASDRTGLNNPLVESNPGYFYGTDGLKYYKLNPETKKLDEKLGASTWASYWGGEEGEKFYGINDYLSDEELQNTLRRADHTDLIRPTGLPTKVGEEALAKRIGTPEYRGYLQGFNTLRIFGNFFGNVLERDSGGTTVVKFGGASGLYLQSDFSEDLQQNLGITEESDYYNIGDGVPGEDEPIQPLRKFSTTVYKVDYNDARTQPENLLKPKEIGSPDYDHIMGGGAPFTFLFANKIFGNRFQRIFNLGDGEQVDPIQLDEGDDFQIIGGASALYYQTYNEANASDNPYFPTALALKTALGFNEEEGSEESRFLLDMDGVANVRNFNASVYNVDYTQIKTNTEELLTSPGLSTLLDVYRPTPILDGENILVGYGYAGGATGLYMQVDPAFRPNPDGEFFNTGSWQGATLQKWQNGVYRSDYTTLPSYLVMADGAEREAIKPLQPQPGIENYQARRRPVSWAPSGSGKGWSGKYEWSGVSGLYEWNWGGTAITSENFIIEDGDTNISGLTSNNAQKWNNSVYQINYSSLNPQDPAFGDGIFSDSMLTNDPQVAGLMDLTLGAPELRVLSQEQITSYPDVISQGDRTKTNPGDFREAVISGSSLVDTQTSNIIARSLNYKTQNRGNRVNSGDPGTHFTNAPENTMKNVFKYALPSYELEALDKITAAPMYEGDGPNTSLAINDLVKFRIAAVLNTPDAGRKAVYMHFRAFINSFNDSYNASWGSTNYVGRGNPFYNYTGFTRTIQMSFTVAAQSKAELAPMYSKLNYLASTLAPDYGNNGFMKGNIVRVTMGGYLYEVPGVINNLSYDVPADTTWEIAIGDGEAVGENEEVKADYDTTVKELPHRIEVTMGFTPIHDFLPARPNNWMEPAQKFISLQSAFNGGLYSQMPNYKSYQATANPDIGSGGALNEETA